MPIPSFQVFLRPVLEQIAELGTVDSARRALVPLLAQRLGLSEADASERLSSGQGRLANRCAWAVTYLYKAGLIAMPRRGQAVITEAGRAFLKKHSGPIKISDLDQFASFQEFKNASRNAGEVGSGVEVGRTTTDNGADPEERIESAIKEIRAAVGTELLDILSGVDPTDFEHIILDVMSAMGYGGKAGRMEHTGSSGDYGVDGIIHMDRLGLDKIFVQAKRWRGSVGRPEVQAFYGALAGKRATKGVMITTSRFTDDALKFAETVSNSLILIDGLALAELMIDYSVGAEKKRVLVVPGVDRDYFE